MRKQIYFLLLSVLLSIPLGMKATIVDGEIKNLFY